MAQPKWDYDKLLWEYEQLKAEYVRLRLSFELVDDEKEQLQEKLEKTGAAFL